MTMVYEQRRGGAPFDVARCKASVHGESRWPSFHQCQRRAVRDGWCRQHHPAMEEWRADAAAERYKKRCDRRNEPAKRIAQLEEINTELLAACKAVFFSMCMHCRVPECAARGMADHAYCRPGALAAKAIALAEEG